jgi:competence protein ComFB
LAEKLFLKNIIEDLVWLLMKDVLEKWPEVCKCNVCQHDMAAIALNSLKPRYVVRTKGEVLSRASELEIQHRADVFSALTRAMLLVSEKPRHDS